MVVILKRINEDVRPPDIQDFLQPALQGGFLKRTGHIESIKIQMHQCKEPEKVEFHALVDVMPDGVAKRVVKSLNRKSCKGKPINVMMYVYRQLDNDRRKSRYQLANDRRVADRRNPFVVIKDVTKQRPAPRDIKPKIPNVEWY